MNVASIEWVAGLLAVSAVFFLLPRLWHRQALFAVCSFGFLATQGMDWAAWTALAVFLASGYAAAKALARSPNGAVLWAYLVVLVAGFIFVKQYSFLKSVL